MYLPNNRSTCIKCKNMPIHQATYNCIRENQRKFRKIITEGNLHASIMIINFLQITKDEHIGKQSIEQHILIPFRELMARDPNTGTSNSCSHIIENGNACICKENN